MNKATCLEVVLFNPKSGYGDDDVLKSVEITQPMIENLDGLISRKVLKDKDGRWMDLIYWRSREDAERAAEMVMQMPGFMNAMDIIDQSTMQMLHFDEVVAFEPVK